MSNLKVTFEDGHVINYLGSADDDILWEQITEYRYSKGGSFYANTGYSTCLKYTIEYL